MIAKTVGVGGDFATWEVAWNWAETAPKTDTYTFIQIGELAESGMSITPTHGQVPFSAKFEQNIEVEP